MEKTQFGSFGFGGVSPVKAVAIDPILLDINTSVNSNSLGTPIQEAVTPVQRLGDYQNTQPTQPIIVNTPVDTGTTASKPLDYTIARIADIETRNGTIPDRKGSQYSGVFQLGINERTPLLKSFNITDEQYKGSRTLQRQVGDKWFKDLNDRLVRNGFDPSPINLWTAHNQGVGGLNQILKGKVSPQVLKNIRNQSGMNSTSTPEDYLAYYSNRLR